MTDNLLPQNLFSVQGYNVVITGAAGGIGRMLAKGFAVNGAARIGLIDINEEQLQETQKLCEKAAVEQIDVSTFAGDLSSETSISRIVALVRQHISQSLDVLIHCAAYRHTNAVTYNHSPSSTIADLATATSSASWQEWDRAFRINVLSPYFLTAGLIDLLGASAETNESCLTGRGSVILFSSPASVHTHQFVPAYQTTKAAVDQLTRILAAEFRDFYIRVNAVSPGLVPSSMSDVNDPKSNIHQAKDSPAKVPGGEEDMIGTAIWLSSRAGAFMDGKVVRVDGGRMLVLSGAGGP